MDWRISPAKQELKQLLTRDIFGFYQRSEDQVVKGRLLGDMTNDCSLGSKGILSGYTNQVGLTIKVWRRLKHIRGNSLNSAHRKCFGQCTFWWWSCYLVVCFSNPWFFASENSSLCCQTPNLCCSTLISSCQNPNLRLHQKYRLSNS